MKLNEIKRKLKILSRINVIIVLLLIATSILGTWESINEGLDWVISLIGSIGIFMSCLALLLGRLLPSKEKQVYVSSKKRIGLAAANLVLNKRISSPSTLKGGGIYRSWNFIGFLILSVLTGIIVGTATFICYTEGAIVAAIAYGLSILLWIIILPFCGFWTYYDSCVTEIEEFGESYEDLGKKIIRQLKYGTLAVVLIIGISFIVGYFKAPRNNSIPDKYEVEENLQNVEGSLGTPQDQENLSSDTFSTIDEALTDIQKNHDNKKMYYHINDSQTGVVYVISWTDDSDEIYVDTFEVMDNKGIVRSNSFVSSTMTKSKMQGQETGILEAK